MGKIICPQCNNEFDDKFDICPACGCTCSAPQKNDQSLPIGTILQDRYIIESVIGSGGFGITYLAYDRILDQRVAIKEYFPTDFASRLPDSYEVCAFDGTKGMQFEAGLNCFVDEALRLVSINHLNGIVRVFDSFAGNCTAYIVMEYVEGVTAKDMLKANGPLPCKEVLDIVLPVLYALEEVHANDIIHRDIAPDNIVIMPDGQVKLLDFGSARSAVNAQGNSIDIVIKRGYAPIEQYDVNGAQGSWTDIYAVAAVMYHLLTGKLPEESIKRKENDTLQSPTQRGFQVPYDVEQPMMEALTVDPESRPSSARELADKLKAARDNIKPEKKKPAINKKVLAVVIAAAAAALAAIVVISMTLTVNFVNVDSNVPIVPNLRSKNEREVIKILKESGIKNPRIEKVYVLTKSSKAGTIIDQRPSANIPYKKNKIKITIAKDEFVMPKIELGSKKTVAENKLLGKFDTKKIKKVDRITTAYKAGRVCGVSIKAGTKVKLGSKVTLYIAKKPKPKPKPTQPATTRATTPVNNNNNNTNNNNNAPRRPSQQSNNGGGYGGSYSGGGSSGGSGNNGYGGSYGGGNSGGSSGGGNSGGYSGSY